jgi:hypothetical protein
MPQIKSIVVAAALLAATTLAAGAQPVSQPYPYYPAPVAAPTPITPQSWSYDPYTSGAAVCPQGIPGELTTCAQRMPPTYGQPNYWPAQR